MSDHQKAAAIEILTAETEDSYGERYRGDFLTLYRDYVASADAISSRRTAANSFFVSINTALIGVRGYFEVNNNETVVVLAAVGILLSLVWNRMIQSYRTLNGSKFRVIQMMEKQLPLAAYTAEEYVQKTAPSRHRALTSVETYVPLLFALLHVAIAVYQLTRG